MSLIIFTISINLFAFDPIKSEINKILESKNDIRLLIIDNNERTDLQKDLLMYFENYKNFVIISRAVLNIQINEMSLSLNDLSDSKKQLEIGNILTATHLLVVYNNGGMNLIEVKTSKVIASEQPVIAKQNIITRTHDKSVTNLGIRLDLGYNSDRNTYNIFYY